MSLAHIRGDHISLIARKNAKYSIRGGAGLVFALFALVSGLIIASIFIDPIDQLKKTSGDSPEKTTEMFVEEVGRPAIKWVMDEDDAHLDYWVVDKPALVSAFLLLLILFLPFIAALGAFNQLSGDIGNRGIRYLLLRTERVNLFLGRLVGTYVFGLLVYAVLFAIVFVFFAAKVDFYPLGDVLVWMLQGFLALALYSLPYVALCAWVSCAIDSPFGSLSISGVIIGFWPLLIALGSRAWGPVEYLGYLMPWRYKYWLVDPNFGTWILGTAAMFGFTALFVFLGLRHLEQRDL